jgi:hypothetical protein
MDAVYGMESEPKRSLPRRPHPHSLATTNGVSIDFLSFQYLDVSLPEVV